MTASKGHGGRPTSRIAVRLGAIVAVLGVITLALVSVPLSSAAPLAGTSHAAVSDTTWAYGGSHNASANWQGEHGEFIGTVSYGFSAILTQTNTSNTTYYLTENHSVGASVQLTYCQPNCSSPRLTAQFSARSWEAWTDVTYLTTAGSVTLQNGTVAPALGLVSSSTEASANISQSSTLTMNGTTTLVSELLVALSSNTSVSFSPVLGLTPLNLTPAESWSSTSAFTSSGSWQASYLIVRPFGHSNGTAFGSLNGSGNVTLFGSDALGPMHVQGATWTQVAVRFADLSVRHGSNDLGLGFDLEDGFAVVPRAADIWESTGNWGSALAVTTSATTSVLDTSAATGGHLGLDAAAWSFGSNADQYDTALNAPPSDVQGAPMSPMAAQEGATCLTGGACAGSTTGSSGPSLGVLGAVAIVGVAVTVGAVAVAIVLVRRK